MGNVRNSNQMFDCCGIASVFIGSIFKICPKSRADCGGVCGGISLSELGLQRQEDCDFEAEIGTYKDPVSKTNKCTNNCNYFY